MTHHGLSDLLAAAGRLGVTVHMSHITDALGYFDPGTGEVHIGFDLTPIEQRCIVAHELGHAWHGHDCSTPRAEREADIYAADLLIDARELANLDQLELHEHDIADELEVTSDILAVYRTHHMQRIGSTVYPRRQRSAFTAVLARKLAAAF